MQGKQWWKEAVVYQIYPRSFQDSNNDGIGDLKGITQHVDYIAKLGVNVVWLCPCYQSPNADNGYDISNYREIMNDFGTMADFEELMNALHAKNIKLIMDLVINHTSDEHSWFVESKSSKDSPKRDYYIWKPGKADGKPPNNWRSFFMGSAWEKDETTNEYYLHLFAKKQPDLNWACDKLREEVYDLMKYWYDKGIDGFRIDAFSLMSKNEEYPDGFIEESKRNGESGENFLVGVEHFAHGPRIHEYMREMYEKVTSKYDVMTVGECSFATVERGLEYAGFDRNELNMIFHFEMTDLDRGDKKFHTKEWKLHELKEIINKWQTIYDGKAWNSNYLSNHDQPRAVSRYGNDTNEEYRVLSAKMIGTMNLTIQGTPYIYQGEEIGMTNVKFESVDDYDDIEIKNYWREEVIGKKSKEEEQLLLKGIHKISRDNARTPMQWNEKPNSGFTDANVKPWLKVNPNYSTVNVEKALADKNSIFYYYQKLIQVRAINQVLIYGSFKEYELENEQLFIYSMSLDDQVALIALNFTDKKQPFKVPEELKTKLSKAKLLISNYENSDSIPSELRPYEAIVYLNQ